MLDIRYISSLEEPELAPYRTMRRHHEHRIQRIFVAEGVKVVARLLESSLEVINVLMTEEWFIHFKPLLEQRPEPVIKVWLATKQLVEQLTGFSLFQGVLAIGKIPMQPTIEQIIQNSHFPRLLVALDGLTNAENVGGIVRCCGGFGVDGIIIGDTCSSPYLRRAVRSSMGTIFFIPTVESDNLPDHLYYLRRFGIQIIAAHPRPEACQIDKTDFNKDCCIIFGSEGYGIRPEILDLCDMMVAIPMPPGFDSLNVCHAAAIFLYEVQRQRGFRSVHDTRMQSKFCNDEFFISPKMRKLIEQGKSE